MDKTIEVYPSKAHEVKQGEAEVSLESPRNRDISAFNKASIHRIY